MNYYYCKICKRLMKKFTGTRQMVREHLRNYHGIKTGIGEQSAVTQQMGSVGFGKKEKTWTFKYRKIKIKEK